MQKPSKVIISIIIVGAVLLALVEFLPVEEYAFGFIKKVAQTAQIYETRAAVIGEAGVQLDIADTPQKRERGLSGRDKLDANKGMLFIFDQDGEFGIWMKEMNFAIDIIWVNRHFEIVHIEENVSPATYPDVFASEEPARFVIEVTAGFVEAHHIKKGDLLTLL